MTRRINPNRAFRRYLKPLEQALGCISSARLTTLPVRTAMPGLVYTIVLNDNEPVTLRGVVPIQFSAGQLCRIADDTVAESAHFSVQLLSYWYVLLSPEGREILAFHWTPEADAARTGTTPHLHVGSVNISDDAPLNSKTFNKLHIPTGYVSLQSVVRFLITELGVEPERANWSEPLDEAVEPKRAR